MEEYALSAGTIFWLFVPMLLIVLLSGVSFFKKG